MRIFLKNKNKNYRSCKLSCGNAIKTKKNVSTGK